MDRKFIAILLSIVIIAIAVSAYINLVQDNDDTVKVGYVLSDYDPALVVANKTDMFNAQGIKTKVIRYNNNYEIINALASGEIDAAYINIVPVVSYVEKGVPIKIISASQNGGSGLFVSNKSGINSVSGLAGKNVSTPGEDSLQQILLANYLKKHGMSIDDLNISSCGCSYMNKSIKKGEIDAAISYEPYVTINQQCGSKLLINSDELMPDHPNCVLVASDDFISKHPNDTQKLLKVHENATNYVNNNTDRVVKMVPIDEVVNHELRKGFYNNTSFVYGLNDTFKQSVVNLTKIESDLGILKEPISSDKLFWKGS